tara:strand:+ start:311 stop:568 length:258 start_codon:yes stop_codon:yes gene_type:complete
LKHQITPNKPLLNEGFFYAQKVENSIFTSLKFSTKILNGIIQFLTFADNPVHRKIAYRKIIFPEMAIWAGSRLYGILSRERDEME